MDAAGGAKGQQGPWTKVLAAVLVVGAIAVAATTGDSIAVRMILLVVSADVAVRLWRWGEARRGRGPKPRPPR